jgi:MSHA pilin protein MshD
MRTNLRKVSSLKAHQGVSLIELIVFIVVISIASAALLKTYIYSVVRNADPLIQVRALELAQARLDEIIALKYDENTPTGGVPACGTPSVLACDNKPDDNRNDVDDFNNVSDTLYTGYTRNVTVTSADNRKIITVTVTATPPQNFTVTLAAEKANF